MTDMERYLRDYWHASRSIGRLMFDLAEARHAYEQCASDMPVSGGVVRANGKRRGGTSPVERAAVLLADQMGAELKSIERRLTQERQTIARIEALVYAAGLSAAESGYVRLRYFENRSVEEAAQKLFCSVSSCGRIRQAALRKIRTVFHAGQPGDVGDIAARRYGP